MSNLWIHARGGDVDWAEVAQESHQSMDQARQDSQNSNDQAQERHKQQRQQAADADWDQQAPAHAQTARDNGYKGPYPHLVGGFHNGKAGHPGHSRELMMVRRADPQAYGQIVQHLRQNGMPVV